MALIANGSSPLLAFRGNLLFAHESAIGPGTVREESGDLLQRIDGNHWGFILTIAVGSFLLRNTNTAD